jgi:hypothetical protein
MPPKKSPDSQLLKPYVGAMGEQRLLTDKDLAGFYSFACHLRKQDKEDRFLYVGLGRSPVVLMEFMRQFFDIEPLELPLSVSNSNDKKENVQLSEEMRAYIGTFLPPEKTQGKILVLVDYVDTGDSLVIAYELVKAYLGSIGQEKEALQVLMAPIGVLDKQWNDSLKDELLDYAQQGTVITEDFDYRSRAAYHMIKVLHFQIDKESFSPYPRVRYTEIEQGVIPKVDFAVQQRLQNVIRLALSTVDEKDLQAIRWQEQKNHSARQPRFRNYDMNRPRAIQYKDRLTSKSATYYDIYSSKPNYMVAMAARSLWSHRMLLAPLLILLIAVLVYKFVYSGVSSPDDRLA